MWLLRYGVVSGAAPGVAAEYAFQGKPAAFEGTVFAEGFQGVLRACGREPAARRGEWRDAEPVEMYQQDERGRQHPLDDFSGFHYDAKITIYVEFFCENYCKNKKM